MAKGKYKYWLTPEGLLKLEAWARDGLTDELLAERINIAPSTLYEWKKKYAKFSDALKKGKEIVDAEVENALLKRALGYSYNEDKYVSVPVKSGEQVIKSQMVLAERKVKEVVPNTTAQMFWLKNRRPDLWREKQNVELSGEVKTNNPYSNLTTDELRKLINDGHRRSN